MKSIISNQEKTIKQKLFGGVIIGFSLPVFLLEESIVTTFVFLIIGIIVLGINFKVKIVNPFKKSEKLFCVFSFKCFSFKFDFPYPDYVSVFSTTLKGSNEYGTVSAVGRRSRHDKIVLKLFKDNQNFSVYSSDSYDDALNKANFIKDILNIELYNPLAENE